MGRILIFSYHAAKILYESKGDIELAKFLTMDSDYFYIFIYEMTIHCNEIVFEVKGI